MKPPPTSLPTSPHKSIPPDRPRIEISKAAIQTNIALIRKQMRPATRLCAVIKADGYGLGAARLVNLYSDQDLHAEPVDAFLLSSLYEALLLREDPTISQPLFVLDCPDERAATCAQADIEVVLHGKEHLRGLISYLGPQKLLKVQINFNTGMSRLDCHFDEAYELALLAHQHPNIELTGVMSHLNCADDPTQDEITCSQIAAFETLLVALDRKGIHPKQTHIHNSSGICRFPQGMSQMVRSGVGLLGGEPHINPSSASHRASRLPLQGALALHAPIRQLLSIRPQQPLGYHRIPAPVGTKRVAIVQMGYADALPCIPPPGAALFVGQTPCPVLGRVCMDFCFIDVTKVDAKVGMRAYLFSHHGSAAGKKQEEIPHRSIQHACKLWNKRSYDWLVHLSPRTERYIF